MDPQCASFSVRELRGCVNPGNHENRVDPAELTQSAYANLVAPVAWICWLPDGCSLPAQIGAFSGYSLRLSFSPIARKSAKSEPRRPLPRCEQPHPEDASRIFLKKRGITACMRATCSFTICYECVFFLRSVTSGVYPSFHTRLGAVSNFFFASPFRPLRAILFFHQLL